MCVSLDIKCGNFVGATFHYILFLFHPTVTQHEHLQNPVLNLVRQVKSRAYKTKVCTNWDCMLTSLSGERELEFTRDISLSVF